jgi:hypothetical protein
LFSVHNKCVVTTRGLKCGKEPAVALQWLVFTTDVLVVTADLLVFSADLQPAIWGGLCCLSTADWVQIFATLCMRAVWGMRHELAG